jgi:hypothetical protein
MNTKADKTEFLNLLKTASFDDIEFKGGNFNLNLEKGDYNIHIEGEYNKCEHKVLCWPTDIEAYDVNDNDKGILFSNHKEEAENKGFCDDVNIELNLIFEGGF